MPLTQKEQEALNKAKATKAPQGKGFGGGVKPQAEPAAAPQDTGAMQLHASVRAGIANTSTNHIQQLATHLVEAEQFQARAAKQLADKALRVAQGVPLLETFVAELNAGMERAGAPRVKSFPDVDAFIGELCLDSPTPEITPRFYLEPVAE
jgi:hypothetical protein